MLSYKTGKECRDLIKETFQEVADLVTPTMGAKGLYVAINQDFDKPTLTDDGVTVAREAAKMDGFKRMIAMDMIEAASNTEKEALDGTTLTILLTNAIYNVGYNKILEGEHPQVVADNIMVDTKVIRTLLKKQRMKMGKKYVKHIATISTKIPEIGDIVTRAYHEAGKDMNVIIEHDRDAMGMKIEHTSGYTMESGFMTDAMRNLCPDGEKWEADNCYVVLMKEGIMTQAGINKFFQSIPAEEINKPFLFILNPNFNPNTLRILIDTLLKNKFNFQFVFVNEAKMDDVYMDCAAVTEGTVQDASQGVGEYEFKHCGKVSHVSVEVDKTIFSFEDNEKVEGRVKVYKDKLNKNRYKLNQVDRVMYERRLGSLTNGIVKIKVGVPTVTEYKIIALKLDDAIGAVRKAFKFGIVLGGGKALVNTQKLLSNKCILTNVLSLPMNTICENAGIKISPDDSTKIFSVDKQDKNLGIDVTTGKLVDLKKQGILDSYLSIDEALKNASSIACAYLRTNTLIQKEVTQNK